MIIPFDINIAKEISSGKRKGRILTIGKHLPVKITVWDKESGHQLVGYTEGSSFFWTKEGYFFSTGEYHDKNLCLEVENYSIIELEFDVETARLAVAAGTGEIVTKAGEPVEITCWDTGPEYKFYKLMGNIKSRCPIYERRGVSWSKDGKYLMSGDDSENDLVIRPTII